MSKEEGPPPSGAPTPPPHGRIEVGLLPFVGGIIALLLVVVVIGGTLFVTRDRDGQEGVATHTAATHPHGAVSGVPGLSVAIEDDVITFTVADEGYQEGDVYVVRSAPEKEAVLSSQSHYLRGGRTELAQRVAPGQPLCGAVHLVRDSQRSGWSRIQCEEVAR